MHTLPKMIYIYVTRDIVISQTLKTVPQFKMVSDKWSHDINIKSVAYCTCSVTMWGTMKSQIDSKNVAIFQNNAIIIIIPAYAYILLKFLVLFML